MSPWVPGVKIELDEELAVMVEIFHARYPRHSVPPMTLNQKLRLIRILCSSCAAADRLIAEIMFDIARQRRASN